MERKDGDQHRKKKAVSSLLGTILLLAIATSLVCVLYMAVLRNTTSNSTHPVPTIDLVGGIKNDRNVSFINRGGDVLSPSTKVTVVVGQNTFLYTIGSLNGGKGLAPGASLTFSVGSYVSLNGLQVQYTLVDPDHNLVISNGIIQEGERGVTPYVQTVNATRITSHAVRLYLSYNLISSSFTHPKVRIQYKTDSPLSVFDPSNPAWVTVGTVSGVTYFDIVSLSSSQTYAFQAEMTYDGLASPKLGSILYFTTPGDQVSEWNFDAASGPVTDSVSSNNGALIPDAVKGPYYTAGYVSNGLQLDGINDRVDVTDSTNLRLTDQLGIETWVKPQNNSNGSAGIPANIAATQFTDTSWGSYETDWICVGSPYYAVVSRNNAGVGYITTFKIPANGTIMMNATNAIVNKYAFATFCYNPRIIATTITNVYLIIYSDNNYNGIATTVNISSLGVIRQPYLATFTFVSTPKCYMPDVVAVKNNIYMVAFGTSSNKNLSLGYIQNLYVNGTGTTISRCQPLYAVRHDAIPNYLNGNFTLLQEPNILALATGTTYNYAVVYKCRNDDGGVYVVHVNQLTGNITMRCAERKFDTKRGETPRIFYMTNQYYGIVYGCEGANYSYDNDVNRLRGFITVVKIYSNNGTIVSFHNNSEAANNYVAAGWKQFEIPQTDYNSYTNYTFRNPRPIQLFTWLGSYYLAFSYRIYFKASSFNRSYIETIKITPGSTTTFKVVNTYTLDTQTWSASSPIALASPNFIPIVGGSAYGVIYRKGVTNNGVIKTLTINFDGTMATNPIIDYYEIGIETCQRARATMVSSTVCALLYQETAYSTYLKTFQYSASSINPCFINSYHIEKGYNVDSKSYCYDSSIVNLTGGLFAVVYRNYTTNIRLVVFQISATGVITFKYATTINVNKGYYPSLCRVSEIGNTYLLAYRNYTTGRGRLTALRITSFSCTVLCTTTLDYTYCLYPSITGIGNSTYCVVYYGYNNTAKTYGGELKTYRVLLSGFNITFINEFYMVTTSYFYYPTLTPVVGSIYAVCYGSYASSRYYPVVTTVRIQPSGVITRSIIDSALYPTTTTQQSTTTVYPCFIKCKGRDYAVVYTNNQLGNGVSGIRIGENGNITTAYDATYTCGGDTTDIQMISVGNNRYILSYGSGGILERLIQISITPQLHLLFGKSGSYEIYANATTVQAKITDVSGSHTITAPLSFVSNWNYVVVTYKQGQYFNLTINANSTSSNGHKTIMKNSTTNYLKAIVQNTNKLSFGDYNGLYDEFTLWASALTMPKIQARFANPNA